MQRSQAMFEDVPQDLTPQERISLRAYRQGQHDAGVGFFYPPTRENIREYFAYLTGWEIGGSDAIHS